MEIGCRGNLIRLVPVLRRGSCERGVLCKKRDWGPGVFDIGQPAPTKILSTEEERGERDMGWTGEEGKEKTGQRQSPAPKVDRA